MIDQPKSLLREAFEGTEYKFLVRHGGFSKAATILDRYLHAHPEPEKDPNYIEFLEHLTICLYEDKQYIQADAIFDRVRGLVHENDFSATAKTIEAALRQSPVYKNQHIMPDEYTQ